MTYRSESSGLLKKYQSQSYLAKNYGDLESELAKGIRTAEFPPWFLIRTYCPDCEEGCLAIKHEGKRHLVNEVAGRLSLHQCPYEIGPEEGQTEPTAEEEIDASERADIEQELVNQQYPDDPNVRDGDGEIRGGGWTDPGTEPRSFADPVYGYPDIPYVDPTRGNHR